MSHYERRYNNAEREVNDANAIQDIREYANQKMWELILVEAGRCKEEGTAKAFNQLNIALSFCGIQGYPVHALGRTYCLEAYRNWMHDGKSPVMTDEKGYPIKQAEEA